MRSYNLVTKHTFPQALERIRQAKRVALDTETTGLHIYLPGFELVGLAVAVSPEEAYYFPYAHRDFAGLRYQPENLSREDLLQVLELVFQRPVVYHNAAYDRQVLYRTLGIPFDLSYGDDTMIALHLMDENHSNGLKEWSKTLLGLEESRAVPELPSLTDVELVDAVNKSGRKYKRKVHRLAPDWLDRLKTAFLSVHNGGVSFAALHKLIAQAFNTLKARGILDYSGSFPADFRYFPVQLAHIYALDDAMNTLALWEHVEIFLQLHPQLEKLYLDIELPVNDIMTRASARGVLVDRSVIERIAADLQAKLEEREEQVLKLLPKLVPKGREAEFSNVLNSAQQLSRLLYEVLGYPVLEKTPGGAGSTNSKVLVKLLELQPRVKAKAEAAREFLKLKLEHSAIKKLQSTYTTSLLELLDDQGRIHTSYKTVGTVSGRMSSSDPNLQNLPRLLPEELEEKPYLKGIDIRSAFRADPGYVFVTADYTSMELVVCAAVSGDDNMRRLLNDGRDLHAHTAKYAFKVGMDLDDKEFKAKHKDLRQKAKIVNFALIYGGTEYTLIRNFGFSEEEARQLINGYFEAYPTVKVWMEEVYRQLEEKGYVVYPDYGYIKRMDLPEVLKKARREVWPIILNNDPEAKRQYYGALRSCQNALIQGYSAFVVKEAIVRMQRRFEEEGLDAQVIFQVHDEIGVLAHVKDAKRVADIMLETMERDLNGVKLTAEPEFKRSMSKVEAPILLEELEVEVER